MHRLFSPGASSPGVQNRVSLLNFHNILHCRESPGLRHRLGALNQKVRLLRTGLRSRDREEEGAWRIGFESPADFILMMYKDQHRKELSADSLGFRPFSNALLFSGVC